MHSDIHPDGAVLSTGTCLVPPAPFTLAEGHVVQVAVAGIGTLTTYVVRGLDPHARPSDGMPWLRAAGSRETTKWLVTRAGIKWRCADRAGGFLASLEGLLGEALDGSGRLVFLGEAGVGKTTLAAALADAVAGLEIRRGSCDNVTTAEALGPILDALPELIAAVDDEAGVSKLRLFRKVRDALSGSPMLLLLEDVHWADEATLDILRFLGRRLAGMRLMILATFRSEEVGRDHPLTVVMGDLAGLPGWSGCGFPRSA